MKEKSVNKITPVMKQYWEAKRKYPNFTDPPFVFDRLDLGSLFLCDINNTQYWNF